MKGKRSSTNPHEYGTNLPRNTGQKPYPAQGIASSRQASSTAGQGRGSVSGPGTPSPAIHGAQSVARRTGVRVGDAAGGASQQKAANSVRNMGRGSGKRAKPGGTTKTRKVTGPSYGPGPGGIGKTGRGAPWG